MSGGETGWFSVKPDGYQEILARGANEQVIWQVEQIEHAISQAMAELGPDRFLTVQYQDLVEDPASQLQAIGDHYARHAVGGELMER